MGRFSHVCDNTPIASGNGIDVEDMSPLLAMDWSIATIANGVPLRLPWPHLLVWIVSEFQTIHRHGHDCKRYTSATDSHRRSFHLSI